MNISDNIDVILKERGMSRRQLASAAKIPATTLQSALARKKNMTMEMLIKICDALNISLDLLLGFTDHEYQALILSINNCLENNGDKKDSIIRALSEMLSILEKPEVTTGQIDDFTDLLTLVDAATKTQADPDIQENVTSFVSAYIRRYIKGGDKEN